MIWELKQKYGDWTVRGISSKDFKIIEEHFFYGSRSDERARIFYQSCLALIRLGELNEDRQVKRKKK